MWTPSERRWLALAIAGIALALAPALAWVNEPRPPASAVRIEPAAVAAAAPECPPDPVALDVLREDTSMGDPRAALTLVGALLDRYEGAGNTDDLYEAVQWMDRGWAGGHYQQSGLATRVFERHCEIGAMRWHWLCDRGE